jgi:hypothetical protein
MEQTLPHQTLPGTEQNVPASDGGATVEPTDVKEFFEVANELLGKNYPSNDSAVKSLKDTFGAVGEYGKFQPFIQKLKETKGGEDAVLKIMENLTTETPAPVVQPQAAPAPQVDPATFVSKEQYEEDMWFASHQDAASLKTVIKAVKKETGKSFDEVLELPEIKPLMESKKTSAENDASRSVIHSNASVQEVSSDYAKDLEGIQSAHKAGTTPNYVEFLAKHKGIKLD